METNDRTNELLEGISEQLAEIWAVLQEIANRQEKNDDILPLLRRIRSDLSSRG